MDVVKLTEAEISQLQDSLDQGNLPASSLPVRQQIWYTQQRKIIDGHVFVDQWPNFQTISCLHTSKEIAKNSLDFDAATFYCVSDNADGFDSFLRSLAVEREWLTKRSVYANFVDLNWLDSFEKLFGSLENHGIYRMYTAMEKENIEKYRKRFDQLSIELFPELISGALTSSDVHTVKNNHRTSDRDQAPSNLVPDRLRSSDADKVIRVWPYLPPRVLPHYFRWTLDEFPSFCLRKKENEEPIAWACSHSCGSVTNMFIDEEYRGRGLSELMWLGVTLKLADFSPLQPYFDIRPGNIASEKSSERAFHDRKKHETLVTSLFVCNEDPEEKR